MADILVVEDDRNLGFSLQTALKQAGHACRLADSAGGALTECLHASPDLALLDLRLPDASGLDLMEQLQARGLRFPIIIMTAFGTVPAAVSALKQGAVDFVEKPQSVGELRERVDRFLESAELSRRLDRLEKAQWNEPVLHLVGECPALRQVLATADRIASLPTDSGLGVVTTLILGETGTGKELVARYIHHRSAGRDRPFIHVNCTAIPEHLLEAEYFGHERGSFTDARARKAGLLEAAHEGTVFLDEIGDMPLGMQSKLLVAIETGRFRRVGSTQEQCVDFRVIAATNCDLAARVKAGIFRADLYHRLNMFSVSLPPLRERGTDIILLAEHLLRRFCRELQKPVPEVPPETLSALKRYPWPGNVRELGHILLRAVVMSDQRVLKPEAMALPGPAVSPEAARVFQIDLSQGDCTLETVEKQLLQFALAQCNGNISQAARLLGMSRGALRYRLEKLRLDYDGHDPDGEA